MTEKDLYKHVKRLLINKQLIVRGIKVDLYGIHPFHIEGKIQEILNKSKTDYLNNITIYYFNGKFTCVQENMNVADLIDLSQGNIIKKIHNKKFSTTYTIISKKTD